LAAIAHDANGLGRLTQRSFWRDPNNFFDLNTSTANIYNPLAMANQQFANWFVPNNAAADATGRVKAQALKYLSMRPRPADQLFPQELAYLATLPTPQAQMLQIQQWAAQGMIFPPPSQGGDLRNLYNNQT